MPELPEVEVVRRGLQESVLGRRLTGAAVRQAKLRWPVTAGLGRILKGQRVESIDRRGKYLLVRLERGTLIIHLGMSGSLRFLASALPYGRHDHVDLKFEQGLLRYHDPRRFGAILWHPGQGEDAGKHPLLAGLGIEPFSERFSADYLYAATRGRKLSIKQMLLAGKAVVGVGNIYASESLFRAGIRPKTAAGRLSQRRCQLLVQAIRQTLAEAIERGGSSLRDFVGSDGQTGYFQLDCLVYGRAGEPCRRCGAVVRVSREQQRATFFCPNCQR